MRGASLVVGLVLAVVGCSPFASVGDALRGASPREQYAARLEKAGLDAAPLGQAWAEAGESALGSATVVPLPHGESVFFDPAQPSARAFRFGVREGQKVRVRVVAPDSGKVFVDLFEVRGDSVQTYRPLESAQDSLVIVRDVEADATYALRLQPELLRGGRYRVAIEAGASVGFPVSGHSSGDIRSFWGAARDGGRRRHEGVDIFAPRGTPVVAVQGGVVSRTGETPLGGKVVWLRGGRYAYYYAHLDSQLVSAGRRVQPGDTLGLVGNTGNARATPPHLHFGIYASGARDPFPFLHEPAEAPARLTVDSSLLGGWVRVRSARAGVEASPGRGTARQTLARQTVARAVGGSGGWYSVVLPDGTSGYLDARSVEEASASLQTLTVATGQYLVTAPAPGAAAIDTVVAGARVTVQGRWQDYALVRTPEGRQGWVRP